MTSSQQNDSIKQPRQRKRGRVASVDADLASYFAVQKRTKRSLLMLFIAVVTAIIFRNHAAWGDGQIARALYYGACLSSGLLAIAAYVLNAQMAEKRGYCLGKYGKTPNELAMPPSPSK